MAEDLIPYLIRYRFGSGTWQSFQIEKGETVLGRDPECDFMLNDSDVSRQHARVRIDDRGIWLADLDSTNGTKVNGVALHPQKDHRLKLGQIFAVGNFLLQINEPSRFRDGTSFVEAERPRSDDSLPDENVQTIIDVDSVSLSSMPVRAMNLMSREKVTIGRALDNDVVLKHPLVSRYHAVIERMGTRYRIQD